MKRRKTIQTLDVVFKKYLITYGVFNSMPWQWQSHLYTWLFCKSTFVLILLIQAGTLDLRCVIFTEVSEAHLMRVLHSNDPPHLKGNKVYFNLLKESDKLPAIAFHHTIYTLLPPPPPTHPPSATCRLMNGVCACVRACVCVRGAYVCVQCKYWLHVWSALCATEARGIAYDHKAAVQPYSTEKGSKIQSHRIEKLYNTDQKLEREALSLFFIKHVLIYLSNLWLFTIYYLLWFI